MREQLKVRSLNEYINERQNRIKYLMNLRTQLFNDEGEFYTLKEVKNFKINIREQKDYYKGEILDYIDASLRDEKEQIYVDYATLRKNIHTLYELVRDTEKFFKRYDLYYTDYYTED